jgi:PDZ domain-containing protein
VGGPNTSPRHGTPGEAKGQPGAVGTADGATAGGPRHGLGAVPGYESNVAPLPLGAGEIGAFRGRLVGTGREHLDRNGQDTPADDHHAEYYQGHANRMLMPPEPTSHPPDEISDPVRDQSTERPSVDAGATQRPLESSPDGSSGGGSSGDGSSGDGTRRSRRRRRIWPVAVTVLIVAFIVGAATVPLPYYAYRPGSVRDTEPLITVADEQTFPSRGSISYTTVSLRQATLFGMLAGWLDDDVDVFSREKVLGDRNADENRTLNLQMMDTSKQVAAQVALERLGHPVDVSITGETVVNVLPDLPADGVLEPGDTITAVNGEQLDEPDDLTRLLADDSPGDDVTVTVEPPTGSRPRDVELALGADPDDPDRAIIGIEVTGRGIDFDFPIDVSIDTGDVGGPSAGLAFTLAIIDDLTPGDLTGGADVAVTGTINSDGTVGPVGGTGQKAAAVRAQGYDVFLVPSADYEAAQQHAGDVDVIAVDTLDEALAALADLGGNIDELPQPAPSQG